MTNDIILIGSSNGSSNLGDLSMWRAAADATRNSIPRVTIHTDGHAHWAPGIPDVAVYPFLYPSFAYLSGRRELPLRLTRKALNAIDPKLMWRRMERFIDGNSWDSVTRGWQALLASGPTVVLTGAGGINDEFAIHGVASWCAIAERTVNCGGEVAIVGQGVGPLNDRQARDAATRLLNSASLVTTRDQKSNELVNRISPTAHSIAAPDWALLLRPTEQNRIEATEILHAAGIEGPFVCFSFHHWRSGSAEQRKHLGKTLEAIARDAKSRGRRVLGVSNAVSSGIGDDRNFMGDLVQGLPSDLIGVVSVVRDVIDPAVAKALFGQAEVLYSTRYHPVVFSLAEGTPAIPLHYDSYYDQKMSGAMHWYTDAVRSLDVLEDSANVVAAGRRAIEALDRGFLVRQTEVLAQQITGPYTHWLSHEA